MCALGLENDMHATWLHTAVSHETMFNMRKTVILHDVVVVFP